MLNRKSALPLKCIWISLLNIVSMVSTIQFTALFTFQRGDHLRTAGTVGGGVWSGGGIPSGSFTGENINMEKAWAWAVYYQMIAVGDKSKILWFSFEAWNS